MSQADLARSTGLAEATVSRLEQGKQSPNPKTIRNIAKALNVKPNEIIFQKSDEGHE